MKINKRFILLVCVLILGFKVNPAYAKSRPSLIVFYSPACNECLKTKHEFMPGIEKKYKDKIDIEYLDIDNIDNYKLLLGYEQTYDSSPKTLPIVFMGGKFLSGREAVVNNLEALIADNLAQGSSNEKRPLPAVNLISRFQSFSLLAIVFAGLIDGINPCAFSVIVFFITFLVLQKYRKREIVATGICFIFAVFATYLLLGLGLFRAMYALKLFYYAVRAIYAFIAVLCFVFGLLAVYDILRFKKTQEPQDMVLRLPERIKYFIQRIIGFGYRRQARPAYGGAGGADRKNIAGLAVTAVLTGMAVSILEAVCTGQVYLPTIAFVLKVSHLKAQALAYLVIYNIMFIIPLIAVFLFALLGVTSQQFSKFMRTHMITIKLLLAGLFFGLGIILLRRI
jgi:hypothetical protein